jgi:hypothetical protein
MALRMIVSKSIYIYFFWGTVIFAPIGALKTMSHLRTLTSISNSRPWSIWKRSGVPITMWLKSILLTVFRSVQLDSCFYLRAYKKICLQFFLYYSSDFHKILSKRYPQSLLSDSKFRKKIIATDGTTGSKINEVNILLFWLTCRVWCSVVKFTDLEAPNRQQKWLREFLTPYTDNEF